MEEKLDLLIDDLLLITRDGLEGEESEVGKSIAIKAGFLAREAMRAQRGELSVPELAARLVETLRMFDHEEAAHPLGRRMREAVARAGFIAR